MTLLTKPRAPFGALLVASCLSAVVACSTGSEGESGPEATFLFGLERGQPLSAAPFPNDLLIGDDGRIDVGALADDPRVSASLGAELLPAYDDYIARREGFAFTGAVFFFFDDGDGEAGLIPPDTASFTDRAFIQALDGPEQGKRVPVQVFWSDAIGAIGLFPQFGHYMMPDTTYAALIRTGVVDGAGDEIGVAEGFSEVIAPDAPSDAAPGLVAAREAYAPLRDWLDGAPDGLHAGDFVAGTVFTTEPILPYARKVADAVDAFELEMPNREVRYDPDVQGFESTAPIGGADLDAYFGVPEAPFEDNPGRWEPHLRDDAALLPGGTAYEGGTAHEGIGRVIHGSLRVPALNFAAEGGELANHALRFEGGEVVWDLTAMVPFSLFLCDDQVGDPGDLPVAIFVHGGSGTRINASPVAMVNCLSGVATLAMDLPFHGGRLDEMLLADQDLIVPTRPDQYNPYIEKKAGDPGFVPDHIGDNGAATDSVGGLYALPLSLDPMIMEANLLQVNAEIFAALRYLREGSWDLVQVGLSFDPERIFLVAESMGASLATAAMALSEDFAGIVITVPSGILMGVNLPMAPGNAALVSLVVPPVLHLQSTSQDLQSGSFRDFGLYLVQWLSERGDSLGYAPYVLRHRPSGAGISLLSSGDSWDETLFNPIQLTYNNALGAPAYTEGADWVLDPAVPGADTIEATAYDGPLEGNVTYGAATHSAAIFYYAESCHTELISPLCVQSYETPHAPATKRAEPLVSVAPICALHGQVRDFMASLVGGAERATLTAPTSTCAQLYGP